MYYLKRLIMIIKRDGAITVLKKLFHRMTTVNPNPRLRKLNHLFSNGEWDKVLSYTKGMPQKYKSNAEVLRKMGVSYHRSSQEDKAEQYMRRQIRIRLQRDIPELIEEVNNKIFPDSNMKTAFCYKGGLHNYGFFNHINLDNESESYLTKIVEADQATAKQIFFNDFIRGKIPFLERITPNLVGYYQLSGSLLCMLTYEEISNSKISIDDFPAIVSFYKELSENTSFRAVNHLLQKNNTDNSTPMFGLVHQKATHIYYIEKIKQLLKGGGILHKLYTEIKQLKDIIINQRLFLRVTPEIHYTFCHGDFGPHNVVKGEDSRFFVLDWTNYGLGPKGYDLAVLFSRANYSFPQIRELFLDNEFEKTDEAGVSRTMFAYLWVYNYVWESYPDGFSEYFVENVKTAIKYIVDL